MDMDIQREEYKSLRNSIDMHLKLVSEILAFIVAATSALLGYGFRSEVAWVFLTPLPIILSGVYLILTQMEEVIGKGAYIMIKHERKQNYLGWDTILYKIREKTIQNKICTWQKATTDSRAIVFMDVVLSSISCTCFLYFAYSKGFCQAEYVIFGVLTLIYIFFSFPVLKDILEVYTFNREEDFVNDFKEAIYEIQR